MEPILFRNGLRKEREILAFGECLSMSYPMGTYGEPEEATQLRRAVFEHLGEEVDLVRNDIEETIDFLNQALGIDRVNGFSEPIPGNTDYYLLDFGDVFARIVVADEYYGTGDSRQSTNVDLFLVRQDATPALVTETIRWLNQALEGKIIG